MGNLDVAALTQALDGLAQQYRGPGGVAGIVKDGRVIARRAWGYADTYARLSMAATTRLPICSISKQFTCAVLLDQVADIAALDGRVAEYLPNLISPLPSVQQLADNQSGLRDYWALTVLQGARPEQTFGRDDALPLLARMKTGHFAPGTSYSYCNGNYRILSELIESTTGRPLAALYAERLFGPARMTTAVLQADTRQPVDGVVGYEGNDDVGYLPADNGIYWIGDAGIAASLDDMLAWEAFIDATRDDRQGIYNRLAVPPTFKDGSAASYGFGLKHDVVAGRKTTGHGGALRGFRAHRLHVAEERLSVVVMFNHEADAHAAAYGLVETALGFKPEAGLVPQADWRGLWLDAAQGLVLRTQPEAGAIRLHYATTSARLTLGADGVARGGGVSLERGPGGLTMWRPAEALTVTPRPLDPVAQADAAILTGSYWTDELEASLIVVSRDGGTYAGFDGMLGAGPMERMHPVADDLWVIPTRRSMDSSPPGDWTVQVRRDGSGAVAGLTLGCWLARRIDYRRR